MFFIATIEKVVRIEPFELGKNLDQKIKMKYISNYIIYNNDECYLGLSKQMWGLVLELMGTSF